MHNGIKEKHIAPVNISEYPAIKEHLDSYYPKLKSRADQGDTPYNLRNCVYMDDFSKQKIIYREIGPEMDACIVEKEVYVNNKCYIITGDYLEYLLLFLNSKLFNKIILQQANLLGGKGRDFMNNIKLPYPEKFEDFLFLYSNINNKNCDKDIDFLIERQFSSLFGLTTEELQYVNNL